MTPWRTNTFLSFLIFLVLDRCYRPIMQRSNRRGDRYECARSLSMFLRLDMSIVREMLNREDLPRIASSLRNGIALPVVRPPAGLLKSALGLCSFSIFPTTDPFPQPLDPTRNLYRSCNSAMAPAANPCNNRLPRPERKIDFQRCYATTIRSFSYGEAGRDLANGRFHTHPSVSAH